MGIFGKRKGKEGGEAAPSGSGIRDLSEQGAPLGPDLASDLGPPGQDTPPPPAPPMQPQAPAAMMGDEDMRGAPQAAFAAPPPPMAPSAVMAAPPPPMMVAAPQAPPASAMPSGDMAMSAPAPTVQAAGGLERLDNVEQRLADMSRRVDLLDRASDDIRNDISRIRDSIAQIEGDMRELTSLYDLISTQINPFIDTSTMEEKPAIAVEQGAIPDLDALFEPTPELAPGAKPEDLFAPTEGGAAAEGTPAQGAAGEEGPTSPPKTPRLVRIGADASCHLALMEWIKYLLERVNRAELPSVLSFYQRIGWISGEIKTDMLEIIRGIGAVAGEPAATAPAAAGPASASTKDESGDIVIAYGKESARDLKGASAKGKGPGQGARAPAAPMQAATWRLSPDDHVASLMYIEWIRSGGDLDRDKLEEIRREVSRLRGGLDGFFSL